MNKVPIIFFSIIIVLFFIAFLKEEKTEVILASSFHLSKKAGHLPLKNPLLGSEERFYEEIDFPSMRISIDPGHQMKGNYQLEPNGPNSSVKKAKVASGTRGVSTNKPEYVLTLEASLILERLLVEQGFEVMLTRRSHDVDISNFARAIMANEWGADLVVRLHADGSNNPEMNGFHILVPTAASSYTTNLFQQSDLAARFVVEEVKKFGKNKVFDKFQYRDDITGFNWSQVPVILIELGFMTNPTEDRKLTDEVYLTQLLEHVADGIVKYHEESVEY